MIIIIVAVVVVAIIIVINSIPITRFCTGIREKLKWNCFEIVNIQIATEFRKINRNLRTIPMDPLDCTRNLFFTYAKPL